MRWGAHPPTSALRALLPPHETRGGHGTSPVGPLRFNARAPSCTRRRGREEGCARAHDPEDRGQHCWWLASTSEITRQPLRLAAQEPRPQIVDTRCGVRWGAHPSHQRVEGPPAPPRSTWGTWHLPYWALLLSCRCPFLYTIKMIARKFAPVHDPMDREEQLLYTIIWIARSKGGGPPSGHRASLALLRARDASTWTVWETPRNRQRMLPNPWRPHRVWRCTTLLPPSLTTSLPRR